MKKLSLLLCLVVLCSFTYAENSELKKLQSSHLEAMNYYGHGYLVNRDNAPVFLSYGKNGMASVFYGKEMATGYTEIKGKKFYWFVEKQGKGVRMTVKMEKDGATINSSFLIVQTEDEFSIKVLEKSRAAKCRWFCIMVKAAPCVGECVKDWKCYMRCAPKAFEECCDM